MRDPLGQQREYIAGASPAKHDCELANTDDIIASDDADGITNSNTKSNAGEDSAARIKTDLRAGATLSGGGKTVGWRGARVGQLPRFVRHRRICSCGPNSALDRQSVAWLAIP